MDILCESCQSKFNIPDEKIPEDRSASLTCPKCKNRIVVQPKPKGGIKPESSGSFDFIEDDDEPAGAVPSETAGHTADASMEKPFDFIEEEGRTALLCEPDPETASKIKNVLDYMEYHVTEALNTRDALKQMRYHDYDMIIVNEHFDTPNPDTNGVLMYISRMPINIRRNIFVAMISRRFKTLDYMMAFVKSVNLIVNEKNSGEFETILHRGMSDTDSLYKAFKDSLKRAGRM